MNNSLLDVIVVGGGQAGLCASYYLKQSGLQHLLLERGEIGESWRSQRWDSFVVNTPNKYNLLAGDAYDGDDPDAFMSAIGLAGMMRDYAAKMQLPVRTHAKVIAIEKNKDCFKVSIESNGAAEDLFARKVVIASGYQSEKMLPAFAASIPENIKQLHVSEFRNEASLPEGAVLVVGSAQSGCQVAEDLLDNGRKVYLSTSMVARIPRKYRGRDIIDWMYDLKFFDARKDQMEPAMANMKPPQLTGVGGNRTISLQSLAAKGAVILGKLAGINGNVLQLQPNAAAHVQFGDMFSGRIKGMIDEFISNNNVSAPAPEPEQADLPDATASCANCCTELDLAENNIRSVIWATGFSGNFDYIKLPVRDNEGNFQHNNGVSVVDGIYLLGFPWLRNRKSALINGAKEDAEVICNEIHRSLREATALV